MKVIRSKSLKQVLQYTKPYQKRFNWVIAWAILLSIFAAARPYLLKQTVDVYLKENDSQGLLFYVIIMAAVLILEVLAQFFFTYWANWLGQDIIKDIREKLFYHITSFKMKYFDNEPVGKLVTRSVSDIESIASIFSQGLFMIAADLMQMFLVIIVMLFLSWKLSLTIFFILPFILFATRKFQKSMKIAFNEVRSEVANLNSFVQERITGMKIVQLFNREKIEYDNFVQINEKHKKAWLKTVWYNSIFFPIAELSTSVTIGLIVWFGGLNAVLENSSITLGTIFLFIQLSQMLFRPLRQIADKFNTLQMGMVAASRIFKIIDTKSNILDLGTKNEELIDGNIVFDNISFSYINNEKVIKNLSFKINNGEKIAIVGSTGSGKTTIVNLISRFYDTQDGSIFIGRENIKDYKLESLRGRIALVLQDVFLFADTILNNITLWDSSISFDSVVIAAKKIGIHDFILSLPEGYNYNVKERGVMLSQGQRQLISFLRAYIKNPSILILDEATSSIDSNSEELIQNATEKITENKTSIIIAHRLSTILNSDRIFVMNKGVLVENGTHKELILKKNGYYKGLYEIQFKKEESTVIQSQD